jgi:hypothetical protein
MGVDVRPSVDEPSNVKYAPTPRHGMAVVLLVALGILGACGGADSSSSEESAATVLVSDSNTAAGRFPDEELHRAELEEAELAAAEQAASEEASASDTVESEDLSSETPGSASTEEPSAIETGPSETSSDDGSSPVSGEETQVGIPAGPLESGVYTTGVFEPAFVLDIGAGWLSFQSELPDFVAFSPSDEFDLSVSFLSPNLSIALIDDADEYLEADPAGEQLLDPLAFNYFDWIHEHAHYEADDLRTELLAGRAVASFDASLVTGYPWKECLGDCALLVAASDGEILAQEVGFRERLYTTDVDDLTLVVSVAAPLEKFDALLPRAIEFLSTLRLVADIEPELVVESQPQDAAAEPELSGNDSPAEAPAEPVAPDSASDVELDPADSDVAPDVAQEPEALPPAPLAS